MAAVMTKPRKTRSKNDLVVNALGEVIKGDEVVSSTVDLTAAARRALSEADYQQWVEGNRRGELKKKVDAEVQREFNRREREALNPRELKLTQTIHRLQRAVNNGRFRVWGCLRSGREKVRLDTEFVFFTDAKGTEVRDKVMAAAKESGAHVEVMDDTKHLDKYAPPNGQKGERVLKEKTDNGTPWAVGPDHGRPERQVAFWWSLIDPRGEVSPVPEVRRLIKKIAAATDEVWPLAGVDVI